MTDLDRTLARLNGSTLRALASLIDGHTQIHAASLRALVDYGLVKAEVVEQHGPIKLLRYVVPDAVRVAFGRMVAA